MVRFSLAALIIEVCGSAVDLIKGVDEAVTAEGHVQLPEPYVLRRVAQGHGLANFQPIRDVCDVSGGSEDEAHW